MKSVHAILAVLAAVAVTLAQAEPVLDGDSGVVSLIPVSNVKCFVSVLWRLAAFVADIPRNCLDLAWRSQGQFFYVLPMCVVYSGAATYQLGSILFPTCLQS